MGRRRRGGVPLFLPLLLGHFISGRGAAQATRACYRMSETQTTEHNTRNHVATDGVAGDRLFNRQFRIR